MTPTKSNWKYIHIQKLMDMNNAACKIVKQIFNLTTDQMNEFERDLYSVQLVTFRDMERNKELATGIRTVNRVVGERYFLLDMVFHLQKDGEPYFKLKNMEECTVDEYLDHYNEILNNKDLIKFNYENL